MGMLAAFTLTLNPSPKRYAGREAFPSQLHSRHPCERGIFVSHLYFSSPLWQKGFYEPLQLSLAPCGRGVNTRLTDCSLSRYRLADDNLIFHGTPLQ